jgi:hypothetical protein
MYAQLILFDIGSPLDEESLSSKTKGWKEATKVIYF